MAKNMNFKQAVVVTPDITTCYQLGLRALGPNSLKIRLGNPSACEGSVDIDACVRRKFPQSNRWDYCFSYKQEVFFVEVHSAISSEVGTVIRKLRWLKSWLADEAPEINKRKAISKTPFYWIQSSNCSIPVTSRQYRMAIQAGIKPISKLELP
jgi:hypothetical protein